MIPAAPLLWLFCITFTTWCVMLIFRYISISRIRRQVAKNPGLAIFAFIMWVYGSIKPVGPHFSFDYGLRDDGSYATNNLVHVEWVKTGSPYISDSATLYVDYRERNTTNEWEELASALVGDYRIDINLANAANYNYNIWYYYIPPEPVVTNGVWKYTTQPAKADAPANTVNILPLKARTDADGTPIATPGQKGEQ